MGRLFWKFFLAFWLTLLVAGAAVGSLVWLHQQNETRGEPVLAAGPRAALALQAAAATLRHGGAPALRTLLADGAAPWSAAIVYAVDRDGKDLLGREVPSDALERARRLLERRETPRAGRAVRYDEASGLLLFVPFAADGSIRSPPRAGRPGRPADAFPPVLIATIGLLASLAFSALLAWSLTKPIRHLRRAAAAIAEGRLETRVATLIGRRADELGELGRDFDQMAQQLQQLIASQRRLLHDVSHELRSPLARLQAAVGLARQNPERTASMLERIERDAIRLDGLVGELLALARLEAGNALPPLESVDLVELVAAIVDDARFEARASGRDVAFSSDDAATATVRAELAASRVRERDSQRDQVHARGECRRGSRARARPARRRRRRRHVRARGRRPRSRRARRGPRRDLRAVLPRTQRRGRARLRARPRDCAARDHRTRRPHRRGQPGGRWPGGRNRSAAGSRSLMFRRLCGVSRILNTLC